MMHYTMYTTPTIQQTDFLVSGAPAGLARFLWDSREARRRPGGASRGGAFKSREGAKKRAPRLPGARSGENRWGLRQTESTRGALWSPAGGLGAARGGPKRPPRKCVGNASSRILRRAAQRSPRSPGGALRRGPRGACGIAAVRRGAPGLENFQGATRGPRG